MQENTDMLDVLGPQHKPDGANDSAIRICQSRLDSALERLKRLVAPETVERVNDIQRELSEFSVRISMVGQVKAGKTALTNALIGRPGLLPSDVNPWTSVITSIHMNTEKPKGKDALFTFFTTENWKKMVHIGGHLGEMAVRANNDGELKELRTQIQTMQARTQARLGRNFDLLLDGYHSFLGFSPELIKKYVCLGDDESEQEGRYADITKSAQLFLDSKDYGLPTVISDTPGVNDPFLLREAVTLDNLVDADICVVTLSAHQAFTSVDISLLRILMALKHEQLVLFVNRIDELQDPDRQINEIDSYIRDLLEEQNLPRDLPIVFGSAAWAEAAAAGEPTEAFLDAEIALRDFVETRTERLSDVELIDAANAEPGSTTQTMSKKADLSGLYELQDVLRRKGSVKVARPFIDRLRVEALGISEQASLYFGELSKSHSNVRPDLNYDAFFDELDTVLKEASDACTKISKELADKVLVMMSGAFRDFLRRERVELTEHLNKRKAVGDWKPDTDSLRRELNLVHDEFVNLAPEMVTKTLRNMASQIEVIYAMVLDREGDLFSVRTPEAPEPKTPTSLMRTMSIDMNSGWFSSWFNSRFNKETYVKKFEDLLSAEMHTTLRDMQDTYVLSYDRHIRGLLHHFLSEHIETLHRLCGLGGESYRAEVRRKLGVDTEIRERQAELEEVIQDLKDLFKPPRTADANQGKSVA